MKKTIAILGLALVCIVKADAQSVATPNSQSETVNFVLNPTTAGGLMSYAKVRQAKITAQGTNTVIVGTAIFIVPTSALFSVINSSNVPPSGYSVTNFTGGTVVRSTNGGFAGTVTFVKTAQ